MGQMITGNFSADGSSEEFVADRFLILLGTDTNADFGGGTVSVKFKKNDQLDWTADGTTYTSMDAIKQDAAFMGAKIKIELEGATSPNLDYTITYD